MIRLPRLFAHRCGGALAPENTLAGLRAAAALGCAAVEFDVMLSADGTPVLIHDETLERTTSGRGRVCDTHDAALFALDAGDGERIPTLAEAAALCRRFNLLANVEIKPAAGHETRTGEVVARFVADAWDHFPGAAPAPLLSSFSETALAAACRVAPPLQYGLLFERAPADWLSRCRRFGALTLHCAADGVDDALLAAAKSAAVPVLCYTVNDPAVAAALFARGVAAVFTDRPDRLAKTAA